MKKPMRIDTRTSLEKLGGLLDMGRDQFGGLLGAVPVLGQVEAIERGIRSAGQGNMTGVAEAAADVIPVGRIATKGIRALTKGKSTGQVGDALNIDTYHGTPHKLKDNRFDSTKIGTGEGAQMYGHGIYLAENRDVAKTYTPRDYKYEAKLMKMREQAERKRDYDALEVIDDALLNRMPDELREAYGNNPLIDRIAAIPQEGSSLYKVDLPDDKLPQMLDWDSPLSKQAWFPKETAAQMGKRYQQEGMKPGEREKFLLEVMRNPDMTGEKMYGRLAERFGSSEQAADFLRRQGVPGIRYKDADSRTQHSGTSNFVVFPQEAEQLKILERNGIPIMSGAANLSELQSRGLIDVNMPNFERLIGLLDDRRQ